MLLLIPQRYEFSSKSQLALATKLISIVVADTTKVRIFKQITTIGGVIIHVGMLLLIPQRYEFSSKSQRQSNYIGSFVSCCWYHKGTNFQANHNHPCIVTLHYMVVADTTKVRIFKQITTASMQRQSTLMLLLIPQRYEFSSKSQQTSDRKTHNIGCCWYHKGTNFQANHNANYVDKMRQIVVADTTKVRIFKQITTFTNIWKYISGLLLIPQRYEFSSKSQLKLQGISYYWCCCWYHKGTNFQANHNWNIVTSQL